MKRDLPPNLTIALFATGVLIVDSIGDALRFYSAHTEHSWLAALNAAAFIVWTVTFIVLMRRRAIEKG